MFSCCSYNVLQREYPMYHGRLPFNFIGGIKQMKETMDIKGFVILPRLTFEDLREEMLFTHFLIRANYKTNDTCDRGQLITSRKRLEDETGWSYGVIRGIISKLSEKGLIVSETLKQKRGLKITVVHYSEYQNLANYDRRINNERNEQKLHPSENEKSKEFSNEKLEGNASREKGEAVQEQIPNNENTKQMSNPSDKGSNNEKYNTLTEYLNVILNNSYNSIINSKKTLLQIIKEAPVKSYNLSSKDDVVTFVDFVNKINVLSSEIERNLLIDYFEMLRLQRRTCRISATVLAGLLEKISRYHVNQIRYALITHVRKHDDKREEYTIGILKNITIEQATRRLNDLNPQDNRASNTRVTSDIPAEIREYRAELKAKGLLGKPLRDIDFDF
jgi:DNA-binding PadR family transcriptional regulator